MHDVTFLGLHKWTEKMFEIFGWMLLAKENKNKLKIDSYLDSLKKLELHLNDKISKIKSENKKEDLIILLDHVKILSTFANKNLTNNNKILKNNNRNLMNNNNRNLINNNNRNSLRNIEY